jgi:hypothetical protein
MPEASTLGEGAWNRRTVGRQKGRLACLLPVDVLELADGHHRDGPQVGLEGAPEVALVVQLLDGLPWSVSRWAKSCVSDSVLMRVEVFCGPTATFCVSVVVTVLPFLGRTLGGGQLP